MGEKSHSTQEKQDSDSKQTNNEKGALPVDHGWAWFVMLGAFINTTATIVFLRSISMFFVAYLAKYEVSATLTTLAFGLCAFMFAGSSLLQPLVFLPNFSERTLSLIGSSINIVGTISLAFSPNIITFNIFVAVIGFSWGFILISSMSLLGKYFKKRLSLAVSVANIGYSVATISGPSLTQYLLDTYGLEGGVLLLAGLNLQLLVGSMLLRPTSWYRATESSDYQANTETSALEAEDYNTLDCPQTHHTSTASKLEDSHCTHLDYPVIPTEVKGQQYKCVSNLSIPVATCDKKLIINDKLDLRIQSAGEGFIDAISRSSSLRYLSTTSIHMIHNESTAKSLISIPASFLYQKQDSDLLYNDAQHQGQSTLSAVSKYKSSSIYTNPYAVILILAAGFGIHAQAYYGYTPVLGLENGLPKHQIPLLLTIAGICDLISKLSVGYIADLPCVRRIYVAISTQIIIGLTLQFVSFFHGFQLMAFLQVLGGAFIQCFFNLLPAITADILGPHYIAHIMSGYFLVNGLVQTFDHILVGVFKDLTDSFYPAYYYLGGLYLLGALFLMLEPILSRRSGNSHISDDIS